jgi:tetratricopeptide (TPR) repeat protein
MEKYKFIVKLGQIKDLIAKGQDERAIELAETVDFKKVKNIEDLGGIAALFLKKGMLLKARECYLELYDRVANRNTVMQLINLALRLKRPGEAEKYLREYQKIDRNDFYGLIFRYNIDKLEGKPVQELIPTLEKLKKKEYIEAWAYELAKLYHKAGEVEKCMAECDDLIVFFGEGEYVERAKALRDYYEKEGARAAIEKERAAKEAEEKVRKEELAEENARAVEEAFAKHDAVDPDVTELTSDGAAEAEEAEEVTDAGETEEVAEVTSAGETEEVTEVTDARETKEVTEVTDNTDEVAEVTSVEETDKATTATEPAAEQKPEKKLDKDDLLLMQLLKEEGIEQPGEIIEEDMVLEDEEETDLGAEVRRAVAEAEEPKVISISAEATEEAIKGIAEEREEETVEVSEETTEITAEYEEAEETVESAEEPTEEEPENTEEYAVESTEENTENSVEEYAEVVEEEVTEEQISETQSTEATEQAVTYAFTEEGLTKVPAGSRLAAFLEKSGCKLDDQFGYLAYINDIRVQIIKALEIILNTQVINAGIAVTGADRTDMIEIIKGIAKIESKSGLIKEASCALAPAEKINKMELETKVGKLVGRCLVIEGAGALSGTSVESILKICDKYGRRLGLILADNRSAMTQLLRDRRELNSILPVRIHVPVIDEADIINMVKYTIMKGGYSVTQAVEDALIARVKAIKAEPAGRYAASRRFINAVIDAADRRATQDYLAATADGRKISGETAIELEDIEAVKQ